MTAELMQLRAGVATHLRESPAVIIPSRRATEPDGFGGEVPTGAPYALPAVRVSVRYESGSVQRAGEEPQGLGTSLSAYVLTDWRAPLREGDLFGHLGETWRVGEVRKFERHGGPYKTESPLFRVGRVPPSTPWGVNAEPGGAGTVAVSWRYEGAACSFEVERTDAEGTVVTTVAAGSRSVSISGLTPGSVQSVRVRATDGEVWSAWSGFAAGVAGAS